MWKVAYQGIEFIFTKCTHIHRTHPYLTDLKACPCISLTIQQWHLLSVNLPCPWVCIPAAFLGSKEDVGFGDHRPRGPRAVPPRSRGGGGHAESHHHRQRHQLPPVHRARDEQVCSQGGRRRQEGRWVAYSSALAKAPGKHLWALLPDHPSCVSVSVLPFAHLHDCFPPIRLFLHHPWNL